MVRTDAPDNRQREPVMGIARPPAAAAVLAALITSAAADSRLDGYNPVDLGAWEPRTAPSAMALVEPLYRAHPEGPEGRPTLTVDMRRDEAGALVIDIEMRGFLDDSVSGAQYRAVVSWSGPGWRLEALGARNICARGATAGIPTRERCP